MPQKKSVVIECDDVKRVLNTIITITNFRFSAVSVSTETNLNNTVNSLDIDLVILGFKKNLSIFNETNFKLL